MITNIAGIDEVGKVWTDQHGNVFIVNQTPEGRIISVTAPDGFTVSSYTSQDALAGAAAQREEHAKCYVYQTDTWLVLNDDERDYWIKRTAEIMADEAHQ
jgi:hypothetical protein